MTRIVYCAALVAYFIALLAISGDIGIAITGVAAAIAFLWGRGRCLRHTLFASWLIVAGLYWQDATMATTVATMALLDLAIAGAALLIWTHDLNRTDARVIGGLSMLMVPAHWVVSVSQGLGDDSWPIYASAANAVFVAQCLIVRGWADGVGRSTRNFVNRLVPVRVLRDRL